MCARKHLGCACSILCHAHLQEEEEKEATWGGGGGGDNLVEAESEISDEALLRKIVAQGGHIVVLGLCGIRLLPCACAACARVRVCASVIGRAASRSITQHHAASRSITQHLESPTPGPQTLKTLEQGLYTRQ